MSVALKISFAIRSRSGNGRAIKYLSSSDFILTTLA